MNDIEYTKHYFIEGERITSKVGKGFGVAPYMPADSVLEFITDDDVDDISAALYGMVEDFLNCTNYNDQWNIETDLSPAENELNRVERLKYFYHPDHLGSSSFITNAIGYAEQHLQYLPFGELFVNQQNSTYDTRYKFSAKELDNETGYNYFGARYYDSDLSVWLSVDPLAGEYPNMSPYMYVAGNPIMFIDPDGQKIYIYYINDKGEEAYYEYGSNQDIPENKFVNQAIEALDYVSESRKGARKVNKAVKIDDIVHVHEGADTYFEGEAEDGSNPDLNYLEWNPLLGLELVSNKEGRRTSIASNRAGIGEVQSPALGLFHEMLHFIHKSVNRQDWKNHQDEKSRNYHNLEEKRTIRVERKVARQLGEPTRRNHYGKKADVDSPTSNTGTTREIRNVREL